MAKNGLDKWFKQKWVDIGSKRKDGSLQSVAVQNKKKNAKRKYPKCVPLAKARRMTEGQRRSAVARKRAVANVGPKPTNVKTFKERKQLKVVVMQKYMGRSIRGEYGGVNLSNPSYVKYYKGMLD